MLDTIPKPISTNTQIRAGIIELEEKIKSMPGAMFNDCFPLKHSFAEGLYVREINVPKGMLVVTKMHKYSHPVFLLKGDVSVLEEDGVKRIKAPMYFITKAGTKRVCYTHEDTVWITVHQTQEIDLEKIEEDIITKEYNEIQYSESALINFVNESQQKDLI